MRDGVSLNHKCLVLGYGRILLSLSALIVCVCVYVYVCVCWSAEENGFAHPEESVFFLPLKAEGGKPPWAVIVFVGSASDLLPVALVALAR